MNKVFGVVALIGLALLVSAAAAQADERADWGTAVAVGAEAGEYCLLLQNGEGYHLVAVDPFGTIEGEGLVGMTFSDIRPGDRIDYAVSTWSGMDVADVLRITPIRHAEVPR